MKARINKFKGTITKQVQDPGEDLLWTLLEKWIRSGNAPDVLSKERGACGRCFIRFEWLNGDIRDFPYTEGRYRVVWFRFNEYWRER